MGLFGMWEWAYLECGNWLICNVGIGLFGMREDHLECGNGNTWNVRIGPFAHPCRRSFPVVRTSSCGQLPVCYGSPASLALQRLVRSARARPTKRGRMTSAVTCIFVLDVGVWS
jgi:hypothetical protein